MVLTRRQSGEPSPTTTTNGASASNGAQHHKVAKPWHEQSITSSRSVTHTRSLARRIAHWGPLGAITVVGIISIASIFIHLQWWPLARDSPGAWLSLAVVIMWNYLVVGNLLDAAVTGPGYVPTEWSPDERIDTKKLQFCSICDGYKAPRSHHCRVCRRCVMKMDHHCPWINNCVGHRNHAMFIKFLAWAVVGCSHATYMLAVGCYYGVFRVWYFHHGTGAEPNIELTIWSLFGCVLALGLAIGVICAVGFLLFVQLKIVYLNKTNVEEYICAKADVRERPSPFVYPYDLGWRENTRQVLWRDEQHVRHLGGFVWPIVDGTNQFTFTLEQLAQKAVKREQARLYECVEEYTGAKLCSASLVRKGGVCAILRQPMIDGGRLTLAVGQRIAVTRANKHWLYGEVIGEHMFEDGIVYNSGDAARLVSTKGDIVRGWFPRYVGKRMDTDLERDTSSEEESENGETAKKND